MGLRKLDGDWLDTDSDVAHWRAHKLERRWRLGRCVYDVLPEAVDAATELALWVAEQPHTALTAPGLRRFSATEQLWQASLAVPEDLVVMIPDAAGYRLGAASLCSPSHWRLEEKIGRTMRQVHDPIPGMHEVMSPRIDRLFATQREDFPVERFNWSVVDSPELYAAPGHADAEPVVETAPLWYRVERQTLRRLPVSGALAFTIRVHLCPFSSLAEIEGALPALFRAIDDMPAAVAGYKDIPRLSAALNGWRERFAR
jgi:hypothetical protein